MSARYFELTTDFDPETRFYYWHAPREDVQRREMSKDVREICPFARNHSGEMFIFSLSFCTSDCNDHKTMDYEQEVQSLSPSSPSKWTNFLRGMPESIATRHAQLKNTTPYRNPSYSEQKMGIIDKWFPSSDRPLVENPIASRFLSIVSSYVKSCALLADVPLTRTVSEMLMLRRNVIFTVRSPDFLIPLVLQRVFRHDEILRKTLWSTAGSMRARGDQQRLHIDGLFPVLEETKNFRFFTQPSTLSHLRLVFSESHDLPWFSRWKGVMIFPSGCTVFDVSLMLLMACLILMVLKSSLRRSNLSGTTRYDQSAGKVYPLKKSSTSFLKSSPPSSVVMLYLLYALFFACFLLANLYAYQCFPRVILPFSHREVDQSSIQGHNLSSGGKNVEGLSNKTSVGFPAPLLTTGSNELCNTLVWMFRRWLGRPYGKRVNIISAVARSFPSSSSSVPHYVHDHRLNNLSSPGSNEIDICTSEFVDFASKVNYNQLRKHLLLRHSGTPMSGSKKALRASRSPACRPVAFTYSVSTDGKGLVSGLLDEGDEIILEEGAFPRNSVLNVFVLTRNVSLVPLYSGSLDKLLQTQTDLFLRGSGSGTSSDSGFAYVSNRSVMTSSSCRKRDLRHSPDLLRFKSWET